MKHKKTVVIGLLGLVLDREKGPDRWNQWRPSVSLCQHEDLLIDRFELLYEKNGKPLADTVVNDIRSVSPETDVRTAPVEWKDPWDFGEVYASLHDFVRNYPFDPDKEDYLVHISTGTHVAQICWFLLAESRHFPGKLLQTSPPKRETIGTPGEYRVIDLDLSKYDAIASRFRQEQREGLSFLKSGIDTRNAAFNKLIELIERVAIESKEPILLTGPTGAGKSQLARRIYDLKKSRRQADGAFVEVNCATVRGDGAMSALFGHAKGSFTGAVSERTGLLRAADKGILFLDEVGELGIDEQTMLLHAIEEKRFLPVGSDRESRSDFQLIAGTNRDLHAEVQRGGFREDLFARINLWSFGLPGLRDRREDIEPNLQYELDHHTQRTGRRVTFNKEARERFLGFASSPEAHWNANFRDLSAAVTRMSTLAKGGRITEEIVEEEMQRLRAAWQPHRTAKDEAGVIEEILGKERLLAIDPFDRIQLAGVLEVCRRSRFLSEAGRELFGVSRQGRQTVNDADRLRKYLARFGIDWKDLGKP